MIYHLFIEADAAEPESESETNIVRGMLNQDVLK